MSALITVFMNDATHCPCGTTQLNDSLSALDHDNRCPECEGYCAPDTCECESEFVTAFQAAHGRTAELTVRALVALGEARDAAERHVERSLDEAGPDHIEWLLSDVTLNPEYYRTTDVAHQCSCGRCYDHESFEALPAPAKGQYMDDGADGCLVLRNCKCGSTRARQGTAADDRAALRNLLG